eukprot:COSAG01_NODE_32557_length_579_cov_0.797917_2_plen_55_part_00
MALDEGAGEDKFVKSKIFFPKIKQVRVSMYHCELCLITVVTAGETMGRRHGHQT